MARRAFRFLGAILLLGIATAPAVAQVLLDPSLQDKSKIRRPQAPSANLSPRAAAPWPRLDPGSLICRSRRDLDAHHEAVAARLNGQPSPDIGSVDCKVLNAVTPIDVVTRATPSATEVRIKGDSATGWTDTWLPSQQPR